MACFKPVLPHFVTGDYQARRLFLGDEEYGRALDCLTKACSDVLIMDSADVSTARALLGKRIVEPQPDWWYMGGRMRIGETPEESITRLMKRELGLDIAPAALRLLGVHSYHWYRRQQPPVENGTCDISVVYSLVVSPEEAQGIQLDPSEYSETRWYSIQEIKDGEHFHPALRQSARDLLSRAAWDALKSAVSNGEDAAAVAELAKKLVTSQ